MAPAVAVAPDRRRRAGGGLVGGAALVLEVELQGAVRPVGQHGAGPARVAAPAVRARSRSCPVGCGRGCAGDAGQDGGGQGVDGLGGADPPGGVGPGRDAVGGQRHLPAGSLFDPVVAPAQADQVGDAWWARPARVCTWSRSQNTAATVQPGKRQRRSRVLIRSASRFEGRYGPTGSALATGADRWLAALACDPARDRGSSIRRRWAACVRVVDQGVGRPQGRRSTGSCTVPAWTAAPSFGGGGQPAASDVHRLVAVGSDDLDQVALAGTDGLGADRRRRPRRRRDRPGRRSPRRLGVPSSGAATRVDGPASPGSLLRAGRWPGR